MRNAPTGVFALALALILPPSLAIAQEPARPDLSSLAWLEGCWGSDSEGGAADECWSGARGDTMIGFHVDLFSNGRVFYEYLRIVQNEEGIAYMASPLGREPTPFVLVSLEGHKVVFENPEHDWPQRLTYWLEDATLYARAEGLSEDSRKAQWAWPRRYGPSTFD